MSHRPSFVVASCALTLGASAALAQTAQKPPTPLSGVTVQAPPPKVIQKQSQLYVEALTTGTARIDHIGRWRDYICVQVVNLAPQQEAMVKARIEEVAKGVGLKIMPAGCQSTIQIVLTGQPQAFVDTVAKNSENTLGFHYPSDLAKVKKVTHPIQGWYKTATQGDHLNHDGVPFAVAGGAININPNGPIPLPQSGPQEDISHPDPQTHPLNTGILFSGVHQDEIVDLPGNNSPAGCAGSLIHECLRSVFKNVLVVVDSNAVGGKDLDALADYLALVALSHANSLDGCSALPSILDVMAKSPCPGREPPRELTNADISFLTALYASDPEAKRASEQVDIAGRMADMLIKTGAPAKADK